jgi:hypothetical protein
MDQDLRFDVALSYSSKDAWVGKDLHYLISRYGFSVYCYDCEPGRTHGFLRTKLREIYRDSSLNVLIWSRNYGDQPKESFLAMERRCLTNRHVEKGDPESLFILSIDNSPLPLDLEDVLAHQLEKEGLIEPSRIIISTLKKLYSHNTEFGVIQHPTTTDAARGQLYPCTFQIDPSYQSDPWKRWKRLADVLVVFPNPLGTPSVYLIPSGLASPLLRHSLILKEDPVLLERKRQATLKFVEESLGRELKGFWFRMRVGEIEVAAVYAPAYDRFLNASLQE